MRKFAESAAKRPVTDDELEGWWIRDERGESQTWAGSYGGIERAPQFARLTHLTPDDERAIDHHPDIPAAARAGRKKREHDWLVVWIRKDMDWIPDLEMLRTLADKTWPGNPAIGCPGPKTNSIS